MRKKKNIEKQKKPSRFALPEKIKRHILGIIFFLLVIIFSLSFFGKAGVAGKAIFSLLLSLIGKSIYLLPLVLTLSGLVFFLSQYEKFLTGLILAIFLLILGSSGILENLKPGGKLGGYFGYLAGPLFKLFGFWVTQIIFLGASLIGVLIFWHLLKLPTTFLEKERKPLEEQKPLITRIFRKVMGGPSFKVKEVEPSPTTFRKEAEIRKALSLELKTKTVPSPPSKVVGEEYQMPPLELLDSDRGQPSAGDIRQNSLIIKKALENFGIPSQLGEINTGPTVTQYTLKPADGIKLSKITTLSNDLALALASHPIRIEAPIPGKSLVGIEVPNKLRTLVRLRDLISDSGFQNSPSNLNLCLGRDVSGNPIVADLARMPHLLVAGSTGTGKTIFLNSLILSLIYRNGPGILRFILIDPKRVEFPVYNELPHLLSPVIFDAQKTVNALKWLTGEMERRFDLLAEAKARDITSYNQIVAENSKFQTPNSKFEIMPYIVLIIDELADLMAARGREVEVGIVRIAQMARAVGIHLVVATQRPSVEVITGLIKANITSRVTFQVASQVDSRTVLDMGGAEKLLGLGDMLFISAEIVKPRRIQGVYVSEKEVRRVVNYIKTQNSKLTTQKIESGILENALAEGLEKTLTGPAEELGEFYSEEDPLYEEAKKVVTEARKASASLLQRKLRMGYARAARLIDTLEERGVVGPSQGAKPREVYIKTEEDEENWQKV
jgi:S-DNA-T family DNA segregation ATPase FtsK/SpoIIIE